MNQFDNLRAKQLAKEHRKWIEDLLVKELRARLDSYEDALFHGYKHGFEDRERQE